jgi:hypothetical protein
MAALLVLLAWPVWRVTTRVESLGMTLTPAVTTTLKIPPRAVGTVLVEADFAPDAQQFTLTYLGQVLVKAEHPGPHWQGEITLGAPGEQAELVAAANWGAGIETSALRLRLESAGHPAVEKTFWSHGPLLEVVKLP